MQDTEILGLLLLLLVFTVWGLGSREEEFWGFRKVILLGFRVSMVLFELFSIDLVCRGGGIDCRVLLRLSGAFFIFFFRFWTAIFRGCRLFLIDYLKYDLKF